MKSIIKVIHKIGEFMGHLSGIVIFVTMLFMTADVVLRYVFKSPITGDIELVELAMVIMVFTSIPHTQVVKGHVAVDIITNFIPRKLNDVFSVIVYLLSTVLMFLVCRANFAQVMKVKSSMLETSTLHIPMYPFYFIVSICLCVYTLCMVCDVIAAIMDLFSKNSPSESSENGGM